MKDGFYSLCKECCKLRDQDKLRKYKSKYYKEHREYLNAYHNEWKKQRRKKDPVYCLRSNISNSIWKILTRLEFSKQGQSVLYLLKITKQELSNHFLKYFNQPCERCKKIIIIHNPRNYEIDHIIPISLAETISEVLQYNLLGNLRLICINCNQEKGCKIEL